MTDTLTAWSAHERELNREKVLTRVRRRRAALNQ